MPISPIPELVAELAAGRMVILVDEEDRENEGDLVLAADHVTPETINFMAKYGRGLICLTLTRERCERLQLPPMAARNGTAHGTAFTVSIEAAEGVTTGISAADRARTVQAAVARDAKPADLVQPGHIFPLQAQDGGVLMRAGHTEAGCDLSAMAGLTPAAVICEIMNDDGTMARLPDLEVFAREHGLKIGTIADLIAHRSHNETLVERTGERELLTAQGAFQCIAFRDHSGGVHLALRHGQWTPGDEVLVRVHEPFTAMDLLDAGQSGHSWPLPKALAEIQAATAGVAVLLNCGHDTATLLSQVLPASKTAAPRNMQMDLRTYGVGAQILRDLGITRMKLLGSPRRMPSMMGYGLEVTSFQAAGRLTRSKDPITMQNANQGDAPPLDGKRLAVAVVQARFNAEITNALAEACIEELLIVGVPKDNIQHFTVPGALEVPLLLQTLADSDEYDALIALGCIIRGETYHFELVANESGAGVTRVSLDHNIPIANAILTVENEAQAVARARDKGRDAARVAVEMANLLDGLS